MPTTVASVYSVTHPRLGSHAWLPSRLSPGASSRCRSSSTTMVSTYSSLEAIRSWSVAVSTNRPPSRETTVRAGRSVLANRPRPAMSEGRAWTAGCSQQAGSGSRTGEMPGRVLRQRRQQPVDVPVVGVRSYPHTQAALDAETESARRLGGVEGTGRGVDVARRQVASDVLGVVARERRQHGRRTPLRPPVQGDARQLGQPLVQSLAQPVLVLLQG